MLKKKKLSIWHFASSNAFRRKSLSFVTVGVLALGVGLYATLAPILESMVLEAKTNLGVVGDISVTEKNQTVFTSKLNMSLGSEIRKMDDVNYADPQVWALVKMPALLPFATVIGVDIASNIDGGNHLAHMVEGRIFANDSAHEAVVGIRLQKSDTYPVKIGDMVSIPPFKTTFRVVGVYSTGSMFHDINILIPIKHARTVLGMQDTECSIFSVKVKNVDMTEKVADAIKENFDVDTAFPKEMLRGAIETVNTIESTANAVIAVAILSCFAIITAIFYSNVKERVKEFAMLKALGWANNDIRKCVIAEALILSVIGGAVGFAAGSILTYFLQVWVVKLQLVILSPATITCSFLIAIMVAVVSALYPASKASRVRPAIVLREG